VLFRSTAGNASRQLRAAAVWAALVLLAAAAWGQETPPAAADSQTPPANKYVRELETIKQRLAGGEVVFADEFRGEALGDEWTAEEGTWKTCRAAGQDGQGVIGTPGAKYPDSFLWTKRSFSGDIVVEFEAQCVSDPANDINFVICGKSPNYPPPEAKLYLFGLGGWGNTRSGVERAPDYKWKALTAKFTIQSKKSYRITAARLGATFYLFVDGELIIEARDPDPLPAEGQFGFHVFKSTVCFRNLKIRKPKAK
jgi:hypothetical protein